MKVKLVKVVFYNTIQKLLYNDVKLKTIAQNVFMITAY